ncbi:lipoate--protein ligase family protein [Bifidobacterium sp. ESL0769]|uniref:lipoyl protein ligase domain-containing protein n=1 Tax=Bifidobacterium sp. ESL0769 TaxID=2983229 RepID=UPI0023F9ACFD|nr:lipoate--protein ligase family protein [Bifidobacterium sp. ESL0769]WEV67756.1 lipoate--protein ligase family protein [Bifidobacterium sp. ESL0769]
MRGEYKTPGGKLVGVEAVVNGAGKPVSCTIDGDFFVLGDDDAAKAMLSDLAVALVSGSPLADVFRRYPSVKLVGVDDVAISTAYQRALRTEKNGSSDETGRSIRANVGVGDVLDKLTSNNDVSHQLHQKRWKSLHPLVVHDILRSPAEQMVTDEEWARQVAAGVRPATLRFWRWSEPAVVVGRFQSIEREVDAKVAQREGFEVVRRTTGGGAMFIEPGKVITYSLYAPKSFTASLSLEDSFRLCDQWVIDALQNLGIPAFFSGTNDISCEQGKIGGAAQRLFSSKGGGPGALLHHVTLAYDIDAEKMGRILNTSPEKMRDKSVKSAVKRVAPIKRQTGMKFEALSSYLETYAKLSYN